MSWEAWGDDDADRYDHLLEAGWVTSEQMDDIRAAVQALRDEPVYDAGRKENGISTRFLMRLMLLSDLVGIDVPPALLAEAKVVLRPAHSEAEALAAVAAAPSQEGE